MRHLITEPTDAFDTSEYRPTDADWAEMSEINAELDRISQEREAEHEAMEEWNWLMQMSS